MFTEGSTLAGNKVRSMMCLYTETEQYISSIKEKHLKALRRMVCVCQSRLRKINKETQGPNLLVNYYNGNKSIPIVIVLHLIAFHYKAKV